MKRIFVFIALIIIGYNGFSQNVNTTELVGFNKLKYSFGKIKQNVPVSYTFQLKNNGSKPLIIEQATAQCGCTTPEYSKKPILKNKTSPLKITFNAANPGPFTKTVTVKFLNIPEPSILTIEGEVIGK